MLFPQTRHLPRSPSPILAKNTIFHLWHNPKRQNSPSMLPSVSSSSMLPNLSILLYTFLLKTSPLLPYYHILCLLQWFPTWSPLSTFPSPRDSLNYIARAIILQGKSEHVPPLLRTCQWLLLALRKGWSPFWGLQGIGHPPRLPVTLLFPILCFLAAWPSPALPYTRTFAHCWSCYLKSVLIFHTSVWWPFLRETFSESPSRCPRLGKTIPYHSVPLLGGFSTAVTLQLLMWLTGWCWSPHRLHVPGDQGPCLPCYALELSESGAGSGSFSQ